METNKPLRNSLMAKHPTHTQKNSGSNLPSASNQFDFTCIDEKIQLWKLKLKSRL